MKEKAFLLLFLLILCLTACAEKGARPVPVPDYTEPSETSEPSETEPEEVSSVIEETSSVEETQPEPEPAVSMPDPSTSFFAETLSDSVIERIRGFSYPMDGEPEVALEDLVLLHLLYVDFQGLPQEGEMICNNRIADDLLEIFKGLYEAAYPIQNLHLIDDYGAVDELSMQANNTSCFCYRYVDGEEYLSSHSYGMSVDINPLFNPMVSLFEGDTYVSPFAGKEYADRTRDFEHKITHEDLAFVLFTAHGFSWGGDWEGDRKDYMHFEKEVP